MRGWRPLPTAPKAGYLCSDESRMRIVQLLSHRRGEPLSVVLLNVDVMHAGCVPTLPLALRTGPYHFDFGVSGWS